MFVPFIFTLDTYIGSENYFHWSQFYMYAAACIRYGWPLISHERYFKRFLHVEETVFGVPLHAFTLDSHFGLSKVPTSEEMAAIKAYPISQSEEDGLIAQYESQFDCWVALLKSENPMFEHIIGNQLDKIANDMGEKPEGILTYEYLPKPLLSAANKRGIPVVFQTGGIIRPPFAPFLNALCLINNNDASFVYSRYKQFMGENSHIPQLSRKGLLRLFVSAEYLADVHNIDAEPEYDIGVLHNNFNAALHSTDPNSKTDQEMSAKAKENYKRVLLRTRPGYTGILDALDDSPTCFHFCCKCKKIVGCMTKGMFEAMLAGRSAHEYGSFVFHSFCNEGIEDNSKDVASVSFLNFVLFGLCVPFTWITDLDSLRFLLSNPSEKELYMRSFNYFIRNISQKNLEFYYMSDNRAYRLGDPLYFEGKHQPHEYATYYNVGGLCHMEVHCTWSNGSHTAFEFDLTERVDNNLVLIVAFYDVAMNWNAPSPVQSLTCEVNGTDCGSVILTPGKKTLRFIIPKECFTDKLQITFKYTYLHPSEGLELGVAFAMMRICEVQKLNPIEAWMLDEINTLADNNSAQLDQISALTNEICMQANKAIGLENQISAMYSSRSWKIGNRIVKTGKTVQRAVSKIIHRE